MWGGSVQLVIQQPDILAVGFPVKAQAAGPGRSRMFLPSIALDPCRALVCPYSWGAFAGTVYGQLTKLPVCFCALPALPGD